MYLNLKIIGTNVAANLSKPSTLGYSLQDPKGLYKGKKERTFSKLPIF